MTTLPMPEWLRAMAPPPDPEREAREDEQVERLRVEYSQFTEGERLRRLLREDPDQGPDIYTDEFVFENRKKDK